MRRKITAVVMGIVIAIIVYLVGGLGAGGITAHASNISISGVGENDAIITDANGNRIPNGSDLSKWDNYMVDYTWGLPDGETIQNGDTATVTFPFSAVGRRDVTFPLYDDSGRQIGTFTIKEGENTGTITFNDALAGTATNRRGTLKFYVKGSSQNQNVGLDWGINKIGWVSEHNPDGTPARLTWNVAFNPNSTNMGQVVITDNMGPNQEYVDGSVQATTGHFDPQTGDFNSDGGSLTPTVEAAGNTLIFTFENVKTAVNMTYHTIPTVTGTGGEWLNTVSMNGQNITARIAWGGSGSGNGDNSGNEKVPSEVILTKEDSETGQKLAGAVYDLLDSAGNIIKAGLTTTADGMLTYSGLEAGNYQFVEVTPPTGYTLNKEPLPFTITAGSTATVSVKATDTKEDSGETTPPVTEPENPGTTTPPVTEPENPGTTTPPVTEPENPGTTTPPVTEPENPGTTTPPVTEPENPGTTTPPVTEPENPGTTTPPVTEPENPGTTTPPVTEPENPGTTTPPVTEPENPGTTTPPVTTPENPGTTTPPVTTPENPGTTTPPVTPPTTPEKPETTVPPVKPTTPTLPTKPTKPNKPVTSPTTSGNNGSTTATPGTTTGGAGASSTGSSTSGSSQANGNGSYVGTTLPQTGENQSRGLVYTMVGLALLAIAGGFGYGWLRKH
ncbi:SpaA isopeptide-forming pilin-related protein [Levilactobacillus enshiensis]|uniref:SpaA isopeptide-forming pilin-related protein n=1 Tax=Levilactobacillus enshiensis TaxID=2590213 RepID=UPI00117B1B4B|nr:SpaA isopeptide-forming pilin-related protein [Levilactobacillus enshiensis]